MIHRVMSFFGEEREGGGDTKNMLIGVWDQMPNDILLIFLMKDVRKMVRSLQCFSGGKCYFNILKTI